MIGSHSGWGTIAVPGDEPGFVVVPGELDDVLAIALANKLARIAWAVLHKGRAFECVKTNATPRNPSKAQLTLSNHEPQAVRLQGRTPYRRPILIPLGDGFWR